MLTYPQWRVLQIGGHVMMDLSVFRSVGSVTESATVTMPQMKKLLAVVGNAFNWAGLHSSLSFNFLWHHVFHLHSNALWWTVCVERSRRFIQLIGASVQQQQLLPLDHQVKQTHKHNSWLHIHFKNFNNNTHLKNCLQKPVQTKKNRKSADFAWLHGSCFSECKSALSVHADFHNKSLNSDQKVLLYLNSVFSLWH